MNPGNENKTASSTRTQLRDVARSTSDEAIPRAHLHTEHGGLLRFARNMLKVLNCQPYNFLCIKKGMDKSQWNLILFLFLGSWVPQKIF